MLAEQPHLHNGPAATRMGRPLRHPSLFPWWTETAGHLRSLPTQWPVMHSHLLAAAAWHTGYLFAAAARVGGGGGGGGGARALRIQSQPLDHVTCLQRSEAGKMNPESVAYLGAEGPT